MFTGRGNVFRQLIQNVLREAIMLKPIIINNDSAFMKINTVGNVRLSSIPHRNLSTSDDEKIREHVKLIGEVERAVCKVIFVQLDEQDKWDLAALYMQVTEGKCTEPEPNPRTRRANDLRYWKDWKQLGDMSREEAARRYLEIAAKYAKKS